MDNEKKLLILDTCALRPNCEGNDDSLFDVKKWINFLEENKEYDLGITPFTLFEVFSSSEPQRNAIIDYLNENKFEVVSFAQFKMTPGAAIAFDDNILAKVESVILDVFIDSLTDVSFAFILYDKRGGIDEAETGNLNKGIRDIQTQLKSEFCSEDFRSVKCEEFKGWFQEVFLHRYSEAANKFLFKKMGYDFPDYTLISTIISFGSNLLKSPSWMDVPLEKEYLYSSTFTYALSRKKIYKFINYLVDVLNLHVFFQKKGDFLYVTRDREMIDLIKGAPNGLKYGRKDKIKFMNAFLKDPNYIPEFKEWWK